MNFRQATIADCPHIRDIWNREVRTSIATFNSVEKTVDEIAQLLAENSKMGHGFFVADASGQIAGFALYGQFRGGIGYRLTMEHTIYIAPDQQGLGIGRELMRLLENHARDFGAHIMFAGVTADNTAGIEFHTREGYSEAARLAEVGYKFERWLDLVLLQKHL